LDLFVANYVDFKLSDLPAFGKGKFCSYHGIPVQCGPRGLPGGGDSLFHNEGKGTFANVSQKAGVADPDGRYGLGCLWTDVDADGWIDLYLANDSGPNFLYHNQHDATFKEVGFSSGVAVGEDGQEQGSMGIAVGDYLHDARMALFVTNFSNEYNSLYLPESKLTYADVSFSSKVAAVSFPFVGWGTAFFDYDNDGWLDLMVVNGHVYPQVESAKVGTSYAQRLLLFQNRRDGTFAEVAAEHGEALMVPRVSRGAAFGDIDNDGDIDVVINNLDGKPLILRNDGGNRSHWMSIRTQQNGPNRDALGTRVKVVAGDLVQWGEVRSGGSYISSSDLRLHYGLGTKTKVDLIEIHWPDGKTETVRDVAADRFVVVQQGRGIVKASSPSNRV
jgi:enediyne biosynthesis protein E4